MKIDPLARGATDFPMRAGGLIFAADYSHHSLNCNAASCRNRPKILAFSPLRLAASDKHRYSNGDEMNSM
jgi:hypothetical protein